jgi:predicted transcriptional regulator of viral defense system
VNALDRCNQLKILADKSGGVFRTADLKALGINAYGIQKLIRTNVIERIKPGYYSLFSAQDELSEAAQIALLFPDGVLCMYTALFYYQYSDRTPLAWNIAIDKDTSKSRFKSGYPHVQPYYLEPALLTFGVTTAEYEDCTLKIFDRDRLVCECIFYENKMDRETYYKAIQSYISDPKKNISNLLLYAEKRKILKKVRDRIGIWL